MRRAYAADQLFATLDTTTRQLHVDGAGRSVSLSDTVGFIRELPHKLVEAFEATLQEATDADLLLHVVDAASPTRIEQIAEVQRVLREIGAAEVPQLLVFNKADRLDAIRAATRAHAMCSSSKSGLRVPRVFISAETGTGIDELRRLIGCAVAGDPSCGLDRLPSRRSVDAAPAPARPARGRPTTTPPTPKKVTHQSAV